jgi:hypothetical protein
MLIAGRNDKLSAKTRKNLLFLKKKKQKDFFLLVARVPYRRRTPRLAVRPAGDDPQC